MNQVHNTKNKTEGSKVMRIYKKSYYIMHGLRRNVDGSYTLYLVTGYKAATNKPYVMREYLPEKESFSGFTCLDGHLPEYCPKVNEADALKWLDENTYQAVILSEQAD